MGLGNVRDPLWGFLGDLFNLVAPLSLCDSSLVCDALLATLSTQAAHLCSEVVALGNCALQGSSGGHCGYGSASCSHGCDFWYLDYLENQSPLCLHFPNFPEVVTYRERPQSPEPPQGTVFTLAAPSSLRSLCLVTLSTLPSPPPILFPTRTCAAFSL